MTLGQEPEALVVGYLRNQRLVESPAQIESVQVDWEVFAAAVKTRAGRGIDDEAMRRRTVTSGCGQGTMFGDLLAEIEDDEIARAAPLRESALFDLLAKNPRPRHGLQNRRGGARLRALSARRRSRRNRNVRRKMSAATTPSTPSPDGCGSKESTATTRRFTRPAA